MHAESCAGSGDEQRRPSDRLAVTDARRATCVPPRHADADVLEIRLARGGAHAQRQRRSATSAPARRRRCHRRSSRPRGTADDRARAAPAGRAGEQPEGETPLRARAAGGPRARSQRECDERRRAPSCSESVARDAVARRPTSEPAPRRIVHVNARGRRRCRVSAATCTTLLCAFSPCTRGGEFRQQIGRAELTGVRRWNSPSPMPNAGVRVASCASPSRRGTHRVSGEQRRLLDARAAAGTRRRRQGGADRRSRGRGQYAPGRRPRIAIGSITRPGRRGRRGEHGGMRELVSQSASAEQSVAARSTTQSPRAPPDAAVSAAVASSASASTSPPRCNPGSARSSGAGRREIDDATSRTTGSRGRPGRAGRTCTQRRRCASRSPSPAHTRRSTARQPCQIRAACAKSSVTSRQQQRLRAPGGQAVIDEVYVVRERVAEHARPDGQDPRAARAPAGSRRAMRPATIAPRTAGGRGERARARPSRLAGSASTRETRRAPRTTSASAQRDLRAPRAASAPISRDRASSAASRPGSAHVGVAVNDTTAHADERIAERQRPWRSGRERSEGARAARRARLLANPARHEWSALIAAADDRVVEEREHPRVRAFRRSR